MIMEGIHSPTGSQHSYLQGGVLNRGMNALVLLSLLAAAVASPQYILSPYHQLPSVLGYSYSHGLVAPTPYYVTPAVVPGPHVPADTPEVHAAKVAHFAAHAEAKARGKRAAAYYGPPAPLNRDGTVALTAEIQQANAVHSAAYQQEYQRLQAAASLAAANPDRTSPPSPDYNPNENGQYNSQQYDNGQYNPALNNPAPTPSWNNPAPTPSWNSPAQAPAWNNPAPTPAPYNQQWSGQSSYNAAPYNPTPSYNQGSYNPQPPAPLNSDGTAAYTKEYQAIAATHQQAYHQALSRTRRSVSLNPDGTVAPTPEVAAATAAHLAAVHSASGAYYTPYSAGHYTPYSAAHYTPYSTGHYTPYQTGHYTPYSYAHSWAHTAAPLNADGTVAETPEVRAASAHHAALVGKQYSDLASAAALAAAAGPGEGEVAYGHYTSPYAYAGHWGSYGPAAPLNADGTVAATPEVAAATAAHLAAHAHASGHGHHYY